MKAEELFETMEDLDSGMVADARKPARRRWVKWAAAAACLILVLGGSLLFLPQSQDAPLQSSVPLPDTSGQSGLPEKLILSDRSSGVTVRYTSRAPKISSQADLIPLTEEEIFFGERWDTAIFKGTVTEIRNVALDFNGDTDYRALASFRVETVYRGPLQAGDEITVLLPCPIDDSVWVEDTDVISRLRVGMTGIFMPIVYADNHIWSQNGATLYLQDIADYGFADGERFAFLETEDGLVYAAWAYESIPNAATLEEIEAYVLDMLSGEP